MLIRRRSDAPPPPAERGICFFCLEKHPGMMAIPYPHLPCTICPQTVQQSGLLPRLRNAKCDV